MIHHYTHEELTKLTKDELAELKRQVSSQELKGFFTEEERAMIEAEHNSRIIELQ